jgi:hypothetical protein
MPDVLPADNIHQDSLSTPLRWMVLSTGGFIWLALSLALAWISTGSFSLQGWASFAAVTALATGILWAGWWGIKADRHLSLSRGLAYLLVGAALLRLAAGVFWFVALPRWGYHSAVERAGYVMADAHARDTGAWKLANSRRPLWQAFTDEKLGDQYGGLLFLSAFTYRYLGGSAHYPLLIVVLAAAFSALAVLFTWAFACRSWGKRVAGWAAVILAVYPEAVLLGSSQMREAFMMTLAVAAFYGLVRYWQDHSWPAFGWVVGALLFCLPISPPVTALLLGMLALQLIALDNWQILRRRWLWLALGGLALLSVAAISIVWGRIAPKEFSNPLALIAWWLKQAARWQSYFTRHGSPLVRKTFKQTPTWSHLFILAGYGVVQPFLPAALVEGSIPLWKGIAIWRALGWAVLLPLLFYAPWRAWQKQGQHGLAVGLSLVVWLVVLIAAVRSGGDQWDNPRYRVTFVGMQIALVVWAWLGSGRHPDPWLKRTYISTGIFLAWFLLWYLGRYTNLAWPVGDLFKIIALGGISVVLYVFWDWVRGSHTGYDRG